MAEAFLKTTAAIRSRCSGSSTRSSIRAESDVRAVPMPVSSHGAEDQDNGSARELADALPHAIYRRGSGRPYERGAEPRTRPGDRGLSGRLTDSQADTTVRASDFRSRRHDPYRHGVEPRARARSVGRRRAGRQARRSRRPPPPMPTSSSRRPKRRSPRRRSTGNQVGWINATYITDDTDALAAQVGAKRPCSASNMRARRRSIRRSPGFRPTPSASSTFCATA